MKRFALAATLLLLLVPSLAIGGSYLAMGDRALIARADGIAVVTTLSSQSFADPGGLILTDHLVAVEESLKGNAVPGETMVIREVGGTVGHRSLVASTAPHYEPGGRALVFLRRNASGLWSTYSGAFGKFDFSRELGVLVLVREAGDDEIVGETAADPGARRVRPATEFLAFVREAVASGEGEPAASSIPSEGAVEPHSAELVAAEAAAIWNDDPTSDVGISIAGTAPSIDFGQNGTSAAYFNIPGSFDPGIGPILSGPQVGFSLLWATDTPHDSLLGETYHTSTECDILLEDTLSGALRTEVTAHEMGHCLGFRHSNDSAPASTDALMHFFTGSGASLKTWDRDATNQVYGDGTFNAATASGNAFLFMINGLNPPRGGRWPGGAFTMATLSACFAPVMVSQPQDQTIASGETAMLSVTATNATSYQWYRGGSPTTGTLISGATGSSYTTPPLTETETFSVRVSSECESVDSATATVTVTCTPVITAHPASSTVTPGQGVTLTVEATGATSYQWFRGSSGNDTDPIAGATSASYSTGPLTATSSYWAQVGNSCGTANSATATITVCTLPSITTQPQSVTIASGQAATLSVAAAGATSLQWYRGAKGTTTNPIAGATSSSYSTGALTAMAQYWVRVGNSCGSVDSETATVSIASACVAPQITAHPQSATVLLGETATLAVAATGTGLQYQWYEGPKDDLGRPVAGATAASFTTPSLTSIAQYWVLISNGCGSARSNAAILTVADTVVVSSLPDALMQAPGIGGATASFTLTNAGGFATTVTLAREEDFFTVDPSTFALAPGASRQVILTGLLRDTGSYSGAVLASGAGVPEGLRIPIRMLVTAPSLGQVDARADENRVDVGAPADQDLVHGSVGFTNFGNATLTGLVTADVPWLEIPQPLLTIAAGEHVTIPFIIHRSLRTDAGDPLGSTVGTLSLQYLAGSGAGAASRLIEALADGIKVSNTLVTVTDTAKPKTKVGAPAPLGAGEVALFIASLGHVASPVGTFISDVYLSTLSPLTDVSVYYTGAGMPLSSTISATIASIGTARPLAFTDLTKTVFDQANGLGTLQVRGAGLASLSMSASVFNKSNAAGTYGSAVPVLRSDRGVAAGESLYISGLLGSSARGRTNLMVQELTGNDAPVVVELLDAAGQVLTTREETIPAFQHVRFPDVAPAGAMSAVIRVRDGAAGKVLAYATPLDALSGDTWVVTDWPRVEGYDPTGPQVIPNVGRLEGANANFFRSSLALMNQGASAANVTVRFLPRGGTALEKTVPVQPRATVVYEDVIGELFQTTGMVGFLEIDPRGAPVSVSSRTFATVGDDPKTFGTGVPAMAAISMKAGSAKRISGFDDADAAVITAKTPATFRTNLGLVETAGKPVTVRVTVHFRHPVSTTVTAVGSASKEFVLAPRQYLLQQGIAAEVLGSYRATLKGNLKDLFADFEVVSGEGEVVAFTSSVDNGTGDQLFKLQ